MPIRVLFEISFNDQSFNLLPVVLLAEGLFNVSFSLFKFLLLNDFSDELEVLVNHLLNLLDPSSKQAVKDVHFVGRHLVLPTMLLKGRSNLALFTMVSFKNVLPSAAINAKKGPKIELLSL